MKTIRRVARYEYVAREWLSKKVLSSMSSQTKAPAVNTLSFFEAGLLRVSESWDINCVSRLSMSIVFCGLPVRGT